MALGILAFMFKVFLLEIILQAWSIPNSKPIHCEFMKAGKQIGMGRLSVLSQSLQVQG